jgi:hypothetical protein
MAAGDPAKGGRAEVFGSPDDGADALVALEPSLFGVSEEHAASIITNPPARVYLRIRIAPRTPPVPAGGQFMAFSARSLAFAKSTH